MIDNDNGNRNADGDNGLVIAGTGDEIAKMRKYNPPELKVRYLTQIATLDYCDSNFRQIQIVYPIQ